MNHGQINWEDIRYVICTAETGSYLRAAAVLNTNASKVTRHVRRLEAALGVKIFDRHAHGMKLSPAGQILLSRALDMQKIAQGLSAQLSGIDTTAVGKVTISVSEGIGFVWLAAKIAKFCASFPMIDFDVHTNSQRIDLLSHDADIAILPYRPSEPRLVVQRIATVASGLFAAQSYLDGAGMPRSAEQLQQHRFVDYSPYSHFPGMRSFLANKGLTPDIRLTTNSASVHLSAIQQGIGIGILPLFYREQASRLQRIDIPTGWESDIWLVSHEETNKSRKTRLFIDFLKQDVSASRDLELS